MAVSFVNIVGSTIRHIACSGGTLCGIQPAKPFPVIEPCTDETRLLCFTCDLMARIAAEKIAAMAREAE